MLNLLEIAHLGVPGFCAAQPSLWSQQHAHLWPASRPLVRWACRFDKQGKTTVVSAFYAVPTGVGRSRLLLR